MEWIPEYGLAKKAGSFADDNCILNAIVWLSHTSRRCRESMDVLNKVSRQILQADSSSDVTAFVCGNFPQLIVLESDKNRQATISLISQLKQTHPDIPVVVSGRQLDVSAAVEFIRAGAYDYIEMPLSLERIKPLAKLALEKADTPSQRQRLFCEACPVDVPIVGKSFGMVRSIETLKLVAESGCNPVLILGETGTGKELAARAVHSWQNSTKPFVDINCAALSSNLLESELFGHSKGSFTGADRDKTGLFELAQDGTIFLDEISEMPLDLQAKLLRVLQERTFRKVGGTKDIRCMATIIASSNRSLLDEALSGKFRKDLYYRLAVFPVTLPPLTHCDRRSDIILLAEYFLSTSQIPARQDITGFDKTAIEELTSHNWPGNVRELKNVIDRAIILTRRGQITATSLQIEKHSNSQTTNNTPTPITNIHAPATGKGTCNSIDIDPEDFSLETAEKEFILRALKETGWQRTKAATLLGITRATLHSKLKRYEINEPAC